MVYTRNPREGRHFCLKGANSHRDGPPEPGILMRVVTFEAMQLRGVSKVATLLAHNGPRLRSAPAADPQP